MILPEGFVYWIIIAALVLGYLYIYFIWLRDLNWFVPEWRIFKKARMQDIPILNVVDIGSMMGRFILGEKQEDGQLHFEDETYGLTIDPAILNGEATPTKYVGGLKIFNRSSTSFLPQTDREAAAAETFITERKRFKSLDILSDKELSVLVAKPRKDLKADIKPYVERYYSEMDDGERSAKEAELIADITTFQDHLSSAPVKTGWYCWQTLYKLSPIAYSAQNLKQMKAIFEEIADLQASRDQDVWKRHLLVVSAVGLVVLGIVAVIYLAK